MSIFASRPTNSMEISLKGKWVAVPCVSFGNATVVVRGTLLNIASVHDEAWLSEEIHDPIALISRLKGGPRGAVADVFTFTQMLPVVTPKYDFGFDWESIAATRTHVFKEWWEQLPQETRKNVRRSQRRGVTVSVRNLDEELLKEIASVNNDSPLRQGRPNVHYGKTLDQVRKDYSSFLDRSEFICAHHEGELIGFLKLVYRGNIASILQLTPKASHSDKRPANALVAKAVELCEQKGISYLTYGLFNYGNKHDSPLREFKIRNGFEEVLVPRYYVPLTAWGALCMKARLHRGLLGILPAPLLQLAIRLRASTYALRFSMSRCSSRLEHPNCNRQMESSNPPAGSTQIPNSL